MSAIGTSPCPPFVHRFGLPPGVLWDGNTVAWYKYNDPVASVRRDPTLGVNHWLDKYNYAVGAEMINQATWFTPAYWNTFDANWSQVGNTLHSNGASGQLIKNALLTIGDTYIITIGQDYISGDMSMGDTGLLLPPLPHFTNIYQWYFTAGATGFYIDSNLFHGSITSLSVKRVAGNHLIQQTEVNKPVLTVDGILFDGINDFMQAINFAYVQPEMIYFVGRQITWTAIDTIFDGGVDLMMYFGQSFGGISPDVRIYVNGTFSANSNQLALNTFGIARCLFNGGASTLQINRNAVINAVLLGNAGNGFTLGTDFAAIFFSNIEVKEIILRQSADNANVQNQIYNYLAAANGLP